MKIKIDYQQTNNLNNSVKRINQTYPLHNVKADIVTFEGNISKGLESFLIKGKKDSYSLKDNISVAIANKQLSLCNHIEKAIQKYYANNATKTAIPIDELLKGFSKAVNVEEIKAVEEQTQKALNLGVKAVLPYDEKIARTTVSLLEKLKNNGYKLPAKIYCYSNFISNTMQTEFNTAGIFCLKNKDTIKVFQSSINNSLQELKLKRVILHEFAHREHMLSDPKLYKAISYNNFCFHQHDKDLIAQEIGSYAATSPLEFVAETFVKLITGQKVSKETESLYKKLKGPEIKGQIDFSISQ